MSQTEAKSQPQAAEADHDILRMSDPVAFVPPRNRPVLAVLITLATVAFAVGLGWEMWQAYMGAPWTRDGAVRAYVVTMAPEVAGRITELRVSDNQLVHKGDLLLTIDPTDYAIAVEQTQAAADHAQANAQNAAREAKRRAQLTNLEASEEEKQTYVTSSLAADASYRQILATLARARVDLERTSIRSPVNGYVTNLLVQTGDYANVGQSLISVVDTDSFWVDGYFEEVNIDPIHIGDVAEIKLLGFRQSLRGHVDSIARAINVANAQPNGQGVATVNPIFTWVRLAQRIPVRVHIDFVPEGVVLVAGMTATVQVDPSRHSPEK